ncbi:MAG: HAD-superfamily hydrolase, subfamily variant 3 [Candidatus Doudnabacteria bacterium]|nr:HAD-superfamily hydrolase, subfamily variant 3 [Candidatus Doudnabacteria bacterium]
MYQNIVGKFDALLADYDGTILNSMEHLALNAVEMYKEHGITVEVNEFICEYIQPFSKLHSHFGLKCDTLEEQEQFNKKYWTISDRNNFRSEFFPGALQTLKKLHQSGIQLGIVSAAKKQSILDRFSEERVADLFDAAHIVGESDRKVDAIKSFFQKNNLKPERVLMLGDVPSDLDYGKAAGVKVAGFVYSGYPKEVHARLKERLTQSEPDFIFEEWA